MQVSYLLAFLFLSIVSYSQPLLFMSYNIRYDNPNDIGNLWIERKAMVAELINFHHPDMIGLQEALYHQVLDLAKTMPGYGWIGTGRDDGIHKGEFSPIFFDSIRWELLENNQFWLSEIPNKAGTISWNAACPRIVTYGKFRERKTGLICWFFNTHFDHFSEEARIKSATLLLNKIEDITGSEASILAGDFNCVLPSEPMQTLLSRFQHPELDFGIKRYGPGFSYQAFDKKGKEGQLIDHLLLVNWNDYLPIRHGVLSDNYNGKYPSDHLPVLLELKKENN
jgi:endonuclease/exonuclease/phosphatase family metal-dependent hydrolase